MNDRAAQTFPEQAQAPIKRFHSRERMCRRGRPRAVAEAGFRSIGLDIDGQKAKGHTCLSTVPGQRVAPPLSRGRSVSSNYALAREADAIIICVPTPSTPVREPDRHYVVGTLELLPPLLHKKYKPSRASRLKQLKERTNRLARSWKQANLSIAGYSARAVGQR